MKKIVAALLVIFLLVSLFASCGPKSAIIAGTYEGSAKGYSGDIKVSVSIDKNGKIESVEILEQSESEEYAKKTIEEYPSKIVDSQSLALDVVSGATLTSRAILAAIADAITKAGANPEEMGYVSVSDLVETVTITITGLPDGDVTITGEQLKNDFEPYEVEAISVSSSGEEKKTHAIGVKLETILEKYGASQKNYGAVVTTATDGYSIEIPDGILQTRDIVIAYEVNGEAQHPRTVVPDERAMYWSKFLSRIELISSDAVEKATISSILLLDTMIENLQDISEDYKHYDSMNKAIPIQKMLDRYVPEKTDFVAMKSVDKLSKNEKYDNFTAEYIMYTGVEREIPLFVGPDLPEGMRVKQLLSVQIGETVIVSMDMAAVVEG